VGDISNTVMDSLIADTTSPSETRLIRTYLIGNTVMMPVLKQNESVKSMNLFKTQRNHHVLVAFLLSWVFQLVSLSLHCIATVIRSSLQIWPPFEQHGC
jgi:hypothetical protein